MTMNARKFADLLDNPKSVTPELLSELSELVSQYPYFSSAHLAYLKGLKDNGDSRFSSFLPFAATHAPSMEWLYLYLNANVAKEGTLVADGNSDESMALSSKTLNVEIVEEGEGREAAASDTLHETVAGVSEPEGEEGTTDDSGEVVPDNIPKVEMPDVDEGLEEDVLEFIADDELTEDPIFEILDQKLYTLDESANTLETQNSLIDQFLSTNPRIVPKGELPPAIEDISQKSLVDDGEIVTEMLAKIYASQGLLAKAKEVYSKLILKYPEKRAYFVAELENLKELK